MEQPLAGVRVLELATAVAGPYAGKLFADFGADVVKVEPLDGDESRRWGPFLDDAPGPETSALFLHLNSNKRSVTIDLATPSGQDLVRRLVSTVDIVIESFPPGTLAGYGLDVDALQALNPSLVVTSVTPFGQDGPYSAYRGSELVYLAFGGLNFTRSLDDGRPVALGGHLTQYHAGSLAAAATMAALLIAEDGGAGAHIDMSIMAAEAASADFTMTYLTSHAYTGRTSTPPPPAPGGAVTGLGPLPNGTFECLDGPVVVSTMPQWAPRMVSLIGDEVLSELFADPRRLADPAAQTTINERVATWFAARTRYEAMVEAQAVGWAVTAIQSPVELLDDPHVRSRGLVFEVEHPAVGRMAQLGAPVRLADGWQLRRLAPRLGEHNEEVLGELGLSPGEHAAYRAALVV